LYSSAVADVSPIASIVSVGFYFEKKRPLATGIAVCGSGIGTFVFSPVLEILSEIYDWKNLLLIMAGIILNGAVFGMLMRPLIHIQILFTKYTKKISIT
jgi:predicted MFS family arabinose efflux permease